MGKRSFLASALVLLACGGGGTGPLEGSSRIAGPDPAGEAVSPATASVRLEAGSEALLFGSGRITEVLVEEGDAVSEGQILIGLSGDPLVEDAVNSGASELEAARIEATNSEREFERATELFEAGALSAMALDGVETRMLAARASYQEARAGYSGALSGRSASTVQAPFDGVVGRVWAREGNMAAGEPLLMITGGEGFVVRALLPERELGAMEPGMTASFETATLPGLAFGGTVSSVSASLDPVTCLLPVTILICDPDGMLVPGMYGTLAIYR